MSTKSIIESRYFNPFLAGPVIASRTDHLLRIILFSISVRAVSIVDNVYLRRVCLPCRHSVRVHSPTGGKAIESTFVFMHVVFHTNWLDVIVERDFLRELDKSDIVLVSTVEKRMFFLSAFNMNLLFMKNLME